MANFLDDVYNVYTKISKHGNTLKAAADLTKKDTAIVKKPIQKAATKTINNIKGKQNG